MYTLLNLLIAIVLTWFTQAVFTGFPSSGLWILFIFVLWYITLWLFSYTYNRKAFYRTPKIFMLIMYYFKELILASIKVASEVLTAGNDTQPAFIAVPLDATTDLEVTLLANFITLTPGTLSIDVSENKKILYIHLIYANSEDASESITRIKEGFEKRILSITRVADRPVS